VADPAITLAEVRRIASLASLELGDAEAERLTGQLGTILEYFRQIQRLDTAGVEPTSHVPGMGSVLREDEPSPSLSLEEAVGGGPARESGFFRVPKVI
jgi:aspartyl-tRNA(Asn)/glutamyl-tRNA(Gln) amidotransferase subunit C